MLRLLTLILCMLLSQGLWAWPQLRGLQESPAAHRPAVGKMLVAMPTLKDPHFRASVVLLIRYGKEGAVGLVINRPTQLDLQAEFQGLVGEKPGRETLYWGGPVAMDRRVMLVEHTVPLEDDNHERVLQSLYLANDPQQFEYMLKQNEPLQRFRVYAGYAGWRPLQLEREIIRGDWVVVPGDVTLVLQQDSESIWPQLINYRHGQMAFNRLEVDARHGDG